MKTCQKYLIPATVIAIVGLLLCGNGCQGSGKEANKKPDQPQEPAAAKKSPTAAQTKPKGIKWVYSVSEGLALAKEKGRPAFIDFYAEWCPPCQQMDKVTFQDKRVVEEVARFIAIKADLTRSTSKGQPDAKKYGVQAIPTYVFIDSQGKQTTQMGYRSPDQFLQILRGIK